MYFWFTSGVRKEKILEHKSHQMHLQWIHNVDLTIGYGYTLTHFSITKGQGYSQIFSFRFKQANENA